METKYVVKLSKSDETYISKEPNVAVGSKYSIVGNNILDDDGVSVGLKDVVNKKRDVEIGMLKVLSEYSSNLAKDMKVCLNMINFNNYITDLKEDVLTIKIDKSDVEALVDAFNQTSGKRPTDWFKYGVGIIKQLVNRKEA